MIPRTLAGVACCILGASLFAGAPRLATIPRHANRYYEKCPVIARATVRMREILASQRGVSRLTAFWRICGILWIISGTVLASGAR